MTDDRTRGVHLSDKQLVFVFMAAAVVAVIVFLFGVLVGRGVQQARAPLNDGSAITASQVVSDAPAGEPPVADGMPRPEHTAGPGGGEKFTYPELLGRTAPSEATKGGTAGDQAKAAAEAPAHAPAPPDVPAETVGGAAPAAAAPANAAANWTVQVAAVKQRDEADAIAKRLKTKGYDAFVLAPASTDGLAMFRVRIGSFKDKRQADNLAQRLLRDDKRYKPWVTR
jgi:DedD protein